MALVDTASAGDFSRQKLSPFIQDTLRVMGFSSMTPVQASVLPLFMDQHKDVVVQAVTGSGKTLAFVLPLLEKLMRREEPLRDDQVGGIILCPTRELAIQTHKVVQQFVDAQAASVDENGSTSQHRVLQPAMLLIGGQTSLKEDIANFRKIKPDILVGTPGRMEEFLTGSSSLNTKRSKGKALATDTAAARTTRSVCNVKELEMLVMDEADRLLELGFTASITRLIGILPKQRRTGCFSATMSEGLGELCRVGLRNPVRIVVKVERKNDKRTGPDTSDFQRNTPASLQNTYVVCETKHKTANLLNILQAEARRQGNGPLAASKKIIVYFATCACIDYFHKLLSPLAQLSHFEVHPLHGQQTPKKRTATYKSFCGAATSTKRPHQLLLCTDVAARGLDLPNVDLVVQFDPPQVPTQFNHRAGRTARAGQKGKATVLLTQEGREQDYVEFMKRRGVPLVAEEATGNAFVPATEVEARKVNDSLRKIVMKEREMFDKGARAFVSFVKSYSKHEASYIFNIKQYDLLGLADAFGLLRLPAMPEFKALEGKDQWHAPDVDWDTYAYTDKAKEAQRIKEQEEKRKREEENLAPVSKSSGGLRQTQAWSKQTEAKERRELRREKKARKRAYLKEQERLKEGVVEAAEDSEADASDGSEDSAEAKRSAKRPRRGKSAQAEVDVEFGDM